MFGREELERYSYDWEIIPDENGEFFWADDVNPVLDKMEARIKELETKNEKLKSEYAYYYVAYTVDEYGKLAIVPKYFYTIDDAKEEMKLHSNFYAAKGTGYIYGVKFTVPVETVCVFEK